MLRYNLRERIRIFYKALKEQDSLHIDFKTIQIETGDR